MGTTEEEVKAEEAEAKALAEMTPDERVEHEKELQEEKAMAEVNAEAEGGAEGGEEGEKAEEAAAASSSTDSSEEDPDAKYKEKEPEVVIPPGETIESVNNTPNLPDK